MTAPELSIIVLLYNEELGIEEMCNRLTRVLDSASFDYEIVMVNDGSTDNTLALAESICNSRLGFIVLRSFVHRGSTIDLHWRSG